MHQRYEYLVKEFSRSDERTLQQFLDEYGSQGWRLKQLLPLGRGDYDIVFEWKIEEK